jgi:hypothetical protein
LPINAFWHAANKLPANASMSQRVAWHLAHAKACACRPIPDDVREEIRLQALQTPGNKKSPPPGQS